MQLLNNTDFKKRMRMHNIKKPKMLFFIYFKCTGSKMLN